MIEKIQQWFVDRGLDTLDGSGQLVKLEEEVNELEQAIKDDNLYEIQDAIGDITVVLIGLDMQRGGIYHVVEDIHNRVNIPISVKRKQFQVDWSMDFIKKQANIIIGGNTNRGHAQYIFSRLDFIARAYGFTFEACLALAYHNIKDRKGKVVNGVFVKEV